MSRKNLAVYVNDHLAGAAGEAVRELRIRTARRAFSPGKD